MPARRFLTDAHRAEDVARPDRGGEAEVRVVRDPQRVLLVVERDDARDRPEDLLAGDAAGVVDVVENRRLDEISRDRARRRTARPPPSASFASRLPISWYARTRSNCSRLTSGPIFVARSMPWPSVIVFAFSTIASTNLLVDRPLHQDAAAGRADLALVDEDAEQRAVDRGLEVRVGEEDVRRLAAELERDLLQRRRPRRA